MKRAYRLLTMAMLVALAATGCAGTPAGTLEPTVAAPTSSVIQSAGTISASAFVEPETYSSMAFLIPGTVKEVLVKEGEQVKAGQPLIVLDTPELAYAIEAAKAEVQSAEANAQLQRQARKKWTGNGWAYVSSPPEWKARADARVAQAQAALEAAQANLAQGTLVAPYDGTVVSIDVVPGEMVVPQKTVLVMGDLSHLQIATKDLSERDIAGVQVGEAATAKLKAFGQDLPGRVISIAPKAELQNGDTVFKVTVQLDQPPEGLMWGMTGDVSIDTGR